MDAWDHRRFAHQLAVNSTCQVNLGEYPGVEDAFPYQYYYAKALSNGHTLEPRCTYCRSRLDPEKFHSTCPNCGAPT